MLEPALRAAHIESEAGRIAVNAVIDLVLRLETESAAAGRAASPSIEAVSAQLDILGDALLSETTTPAQLADQRDLYLILTKNPELVHKLSSLDIDKLTDRKSILDQVSPHSRAPRR
jgi:hypothetical protein